MAIRSGTITEGGLKIKWNETATGISYSNGKVAVPSPGNMDAKIAYKTATSVVVPPKEPPVVIPPTVPQQPDTKVRSISSKELEQSRLSGEAVQLVKGNYNSQIWITDAKNSVIDLSLATFGAKEPCFEFKGDFSGTTVQGGLFKDCGKVINYDNEVTVRNFTLKGITAINSGQVFASGGYIDAQGIYGKMIGFKMFDCVIKDSPDMSTAVWLNAAEDFEIYGNQLSNINLELAQHTGLFMLGGNGVFRNNKSIGRRGDLVRATPYQVDASGKVLLITNNIDYNSVQYGSYEVKTNDINKFNTFKPINVVVSNNTSGKLNTSKIWAGQLIDIYDTYGEVKVEKNLLFDAYHEGQSKVKDVINYESVSSVTKVIDAGNNLYFDTWEQAVGNLTTFRSLHPGIGAI